VYYHYKSPLSQSLAFEQLLLYLTALIGQKSLLLLSSLRRARRRRRRTVVPIVKNPPKNKLAHGDFTSFPMQDSAYSHNFCFRLPELHIQKISNC
jgi:hypothetical protein